MGVKVELFTILKRRPNIFLLKKNYSGANLTEQDFIT